MTPAELATDYVRVMTERDKYRAENIRLLAEVDRLTLHVNNLGSVLSGVRAAERARIRAGVEGLYADAGRDMGADPDETVLLGLAAVLRVIDGGEE